MAMRALLRRVWHYWAEAANYIGDFQARLLLTLFYFTVLMPYGLIVRLFGDPLHITRRPAVSGWIRREARNIDWHTARRQF